MSAEPAEPEPDYAADDPSDNIQTKRIDAIFQARQRVVEQKRFAKDGLVFKKFGRETKNELIRDAVEDYLHELQWLMDSHQDKTETDYLQSVELGYMERPDGGVIPFDGVLSVLNAPRPFQFRVRQEADSHLHGKQVSVDVVSKTIPEHVLLNAFSAANQFCTEIGLDVRIQRATDPIFGFEEVAE